MENKNDAENLYLRRLDSGKILDISQKFSSGPVPYDTKCPKCNRREIKLSITKNESISYIPPSIDTKCPKCNRRERSFLLKRLSITKNESFSYIPPPIDNDITLTSQFPVNPEALIDEDQSNSMIEDIQHYVKLEELTVDDQLNSFEVDIQHHVKPEGLTDEDQSNPINEDIQYHIEPEVQNEDHSRSMEEYIDSNEDVSTAPSNAKRRQLHYCIFCQKLILNFSRHIIRHHDSEEQVAPILNLPPKSKERIVIIEKLRLMGANKYNLSCSPEKRIIRRRNVTPSATTPCPYCKAWLSKYNLYKHRCKLLKTSLTVGQVAGRKLQSMSKKVLLGV